MNILIAGSRSIPIWATVKWLETLNLTPEDTIIHGGAQGVDTGAADYAAIWGIPQIVYKPDWEGKGKAAGPLRNVAMVKDADVVHVLWDGESKGTKSTITNAIKQKKPLTVHYFKEHLNGSVSKVSSGAKP